MKMSPLKKYLKKKKWRWIDFCEAMEQETGYRPGVSTVGMWVCGHRVPSRLSAQMIERTTKGEVTRESWIRWKVAKANMRKS